MKFAALAVVLIVCLSVLPETEAQELYMVPSSCKMNVRGCPRNRADRECNKCCRRSGCDRGDCNGYNCRCRGCARG